jgi:hypothetical protein
MMLPSLFTLERRRQAEVLAGYGLTPERMGVPVVSSLVGPPSMKGLPASGAEMANACSDDALLG